MRPGRVGGQLGGAEHCPGVAGLRPATGESWEGPSHREAAVNTGFGAGSQTARYLGHKGQ